jgi:DNA-binding HxlR family transcriptional regulator
MRDPLEQSGTNQSDSEGGSEDAVTHLHDVLSQRWAIYVLIQLARGPKRFNDLAKLTKVNPNTLRERLRELEDVSLVERRVLSAMPPRVEYRIGAGGAELLPILHELDGWVLAQVRTPANAVVDASARQAATLAETLNE